MKLDCSVAKKIGSRGIVAVLVIDRVEDAVPVAEALLEGGVDIIELTLRTPAAMDALATVKAEVPGILAGVGTILMPQQVKEVKEAGADFGVAPGVNATVLKAAQEANFPFAPGIMTPTDIETSLEFGSEVLKFFPAGSSGGLAHLKNIAAPYQHLGLKFIPLGGVNADNMKNYLSSPLVCALGGSWLAGKALIEARDWAGITENARNAVRKVTEGRSDS